MSCFGTCEIVKGWHFGSRENISSQMNSKFKKYLRFKKDKVRVTDKNLEILGKYGETIERGMKLAELIKRPNLNYDIIRELDQKTQELNLPKDITEQVEIEIKYDGYLKRQQIQIESADKLEKIKIPNDIDYDKISHISIETRDKLKKIKPVTLAQASRIGGVKPADISVLMVLLSR